MKQLYVDVSPPGFLWDPHLNLANVTFDFDAQIKYAKYTKIFDMVTLTFDP